MPKIYIGGIGSQFTELQLAELVAIHGEILTVKIVYDRTTKKAKGFGFVEMRSPQAAQQAVDALNGATIGKREIRAALVAETKDQHPASPSESRPVAKKSKRTRKVAYLPVSKTHPATR